MEIRWMKYKNENGEKENFYPVTHVDAIVGLEDVDFGDLTSSTDLIDTEADGNIEVGDIEIPVVIQNEIDEVQNEVNNKITTLENRLNQMIDVIYPVGSIYISANSVSPATLFGGTWEQIQDRFLLSSGSTYGAGTTGGEATHTLTEQEMPSHTHAFTGTTTYHDHTSNVFNTNNTYYTMAISGIRLNSVSWVEAGNTTAGGPGGDPCGITSTAEITPYGTNSFAGVGIAHNNMPPYLTVYMWKRIS